MSELVTIPLWGSFSIIGILISIIVTFLIMLFRGDIATRKQMDQVQRLADTALKAWEIEKETNQGQAEVLNKLLVSSDTMLRILDARPTAPQGGSQR